MGENILEHSAEYPHSQTPESIAGSWWTVQDNPVFRNLLSDQCVQACGCPNAVSHVPTGSQGWSPECSGKERAREGSRAQEIKGGVVVWSQKHRGYRAGHNPQGCKHLVPASDLSPWITMCSQALSRPQAEWQIQPAMNPSSWKQLHAKCQAQLAQNSSSTQGLRSHTVRDPISIREPHDASVLPKRDSSRRPTTSNPQNRSHWPTNHCRT